MRHRGSIHQRTLIGVIGIAVAAIVVYLGFTKSIPFRHHYEVKAAFASSNNLRPASPVRIAGVEVGRVVKVEPVHAGSPGALVTMRLNKQGLPLHDDAKFAIRPRIFLEGNFFVDVTPGSASSPEANDGHTFPVQQTKTPVQLDQVLTALQSDTRDDLKLLLKEYSSALEDKGAKGFNNSIPYWLPAYRDSAIVADAALGEGDHDLSSYVASAGAVAAALDRHGEQLKSLVTDFDTFAGALARENGNLSASIAELPRTLAVARPALGQLNASFPALRGLAHDLRPGVRSSGPTLDAATPFVTQLRGLVSEPELRGLTRDLRPTVPALAHLTEDSVGLSREGRRLASCQNEVIVPTVNDKIGDPVFPTDQKVYQEAPKPFVGLAGESRSGDANGQWFRVLAAGGTNLITLRPGVFATSALPINGAIPQKPKSRPPLNEDAPCELQQPPDLRAKPSNPPPQHQVSTTSDLFKLRYAKARTAAIDWLTSAIKAGGLSDILKVSDQDATAGLLDKLTGAAQAADATRAAKIREDDN
jgi:phospholipid/cholesterol/gamma-HCH transport system substrate-binding protein